MFFFFFLTMKGKILNIKTVVLFKPKNRYKYIHVTFKKYVPKKIKTPIGIN